MCAVGFFAGHASSQDVLGTRASRPHSYFRGLRPRAGGTPAFPGTCPHKRRRNVWFAFGHDHLGLTMGGITGKPVPELVAGKTPSVDLTPFRPNRFRPGHVRRALPRTPRRCAPHG